MKITTLSLACSLSLGLATTGGCTSSSPGGSDPADGGAVDDAESAADASSGGDAAADANGQSPMCKLAFFPSDFDPRCQVAHDTQCCAEQKACAANADCVSLVACVNACPAPRQDTCVQACAGDAGNPPGFAELDAIATCAKRSEYEPPAGVDCSWPD